MWKIIFNQSFVAFFNIFADDKILILGDFNARVNQNSAFWADMALETATKTGVYCSSFAQSNNLSSLTPFSNKRTTDASLV